MDLVHLSGSPRRGGNSDTVAQRFLDRCRDNGAAITSYHLNTLTYKGCQGCNGCKTGADKCIVLDDLEKVLDDVFGADLVVFSSPVYYGDVSAQLKGFIDRTYSYLRPGYVSKKHPSRLERRKPLVFILAQGHRSSAMYDDIIPRYSAIFHWTGFAETHPLRVVDVYHRGDIDKRDDIFIQAEHLADRLMGSLC